METLFALALYFVFIYLELAPVNFMHLGFANKYRAWSYTLAIYTFRSTARSITNTLVNRGVFSITNTLVNTGLLPTHWLAEENYQHNG